MSLGDARRRAEEMRGIIEELIPPRHDLTPAQFRTLLRASLFPPLVQNGRARKTVEALEAEGLIEYDFDLTPVNEFDVTERFEIRPTEEGRKLAARCFRDGGRWRHYKAANGRWVTHRVTRLSSDHLYVTRACDGQTVKTLGEVERISANEVETHGCDHCKRLDRDLSRDAARA